MLMEWNIDATAKTKDRGKEYIRAQATVPDAVKDAVCVLIDGLPEKREDLTIKIHTSGALRSWADYVETIPPRPKPTGFFNLWIGTSDQPATV